MQCPYCHGASAQFLETKDYNRRVSKTVFVYFVCGSCGLIYLTNTPENLASYYLDDYHGIPRDLTQVSRAAEFEQYKINIVQEFKSPGRLLEIGPSYGAFSLLAKQSGFDVSAIEMDADCCRFIESEVGVSTVCSANPASAIDELTDAYDVIALWHSIEHIPRSWEVLRAAAKRLAPGGILLIAAPNPASLQFRLFGKYWTHIDAPRHLYMFPLEWFEDRAKELGLRVALRTTTDEGSLGWNDFGWKFSFANFGSNRVTRKVLKIMGTLISILMGHFESTGERGCAYTIVLQKGDR